ncbi:MULTISPECIES: metal ABC transporter ATP-binding protein [Planococcus]|uniref:Zinc ABC transporter ATP-binding protein n=2 Tax=Planococcus TaxID=1372 RepID=A0ABN4JY83_9BACL|nr:MULTISPECIES: metal ABC transporter ATP-binding protein [Planococcus]ALS78883.1 zinc ABC transporter ATP-binding protein [Planococcus kocurii]AQU79160.1 zinc ABC transporter ATP-binding protein [Planococcus faecalis]KAA0957749.1 metal ABC transporter ATP-binding protein [Planococcus sp. ANT_H30]MDJ0331103.1 metal ABC transporter ATP-binding protein [Planococcus sp. S3-L1]OHX51780.1 zinc ABC transporter ATP-binding protein [Planococcus faecalis]
MAAPLIDIKNISFEYEQTKALHNISMTVEEGDFLAILGPNGSGKSTLLKIMLGLIKPTAGKIELFGEDAKKFKKREWIGYVSQKSNSFNSGFPAIVKEVVAGGLAKKTGLFHRLPKSTHEQVAEALEAVGMADFIDRSISELSGGQQQRIFIARALVAKPKILILDEPTVGVDHQNVQSFYDMLAKLNRDKHITMVLVTHDVDTVTDRITHVACLNQTIHFHGFKEQLHTMSDEQREAWYGHSVRKIHHIGGSHA